MPVITTEESKVHFMLGLIKLLWHCTVLIGFLNTDTNVEGNRDQIKKKKMTHLNVNIKSFT